MNGQMAASAKRADGKMTPLDAFSGLMGHSMGADAKNLVRQRRLYRFDALPLSPAGPGRVFPDGRRVGRDPEARTGMGIGGNGNVAVQFQVTSTVESFSGRSAGGAD